MKVQALMKVQPLKSLSFTKYLSVFSLQVTRKGGQDGRGGADGSAAEAADVGTARGAWFLHH